MLIDLGPFSREPIPEQDIERAGELAVERGWKDRGGVQAELAEAKDAWDEWYEIAALRLRRAEAAEQTIQQLRAALERTRDIATRGVGPDTTTDEALATIAQYVTLRLAALATTPPTTGSEA
jgi:hypothetical protein